MRHDFRLLRFLLRNALIGVAVGWNVLGLLVVTDTFGLGTLLASSEHRAIALALLLVGFAATFGGVAAASAVFLMPWEPPPPGARIWGEEPPRHD